GIAALTAEAILIPVRAGIAAAGGSVEYTVGGRDVRFYIEGRKRTFESKILPLFSAALAKPDFRPGVLQAARAALDRKITQNQSVALTVGIEMLDRAFYQDSDAGLPEYGLASTVAGLSSSDAFQFYRGTYRRNGAIISAVGDLSALSSKALQSLSTALQTGGSAPAAVKQLSLNGSSRQLVTHRAVPVAWLVAQYPAPSIGSKDFGPMLVLSTFVERTLSDVAEVPSIASRSFTQQAVGVIYNFDQRPANLIVYVDGGQGDPNRAFGTALTVVGLFGSTKLNGNIENMKAVARGRFLGEATTLEDRAWIAGVFAAQSGSPDYLSAGVSAISKVTAGDLQRVARKYLSSPTVALVLPRE
ncbi:MAG: hypothetical protein ABI182_00105, partial [Candidatus Baltobacteraceae bacterium]